MLVRCLPEFVVDEGHLPLAVPEIAISIDETQTITKQNTVLMMYKYVVAVTTLQATGFLYLPVSEMKHDAESPDCSHTICGIFHRLPNKHFPLIRAVNLSTNATHPHAFMSERQQANFHSATWIVYYCTHFVKISFIYANIFVFHIQCCRFSLPKCNFFQIFLK